MTLMREGEPGEYKEDAGGRPLSGIYSDMDEIDHALHNGTITLHSKIRARVWTENEAGERVFERVETTPGRMKLGALLPESDLLTFDIVNRLIRKREVGDVIDTVYRFCGQKDT